MKFKLLIIVAIALSDFTAIAQDKVCFNKKNDKIAVRSECLASEKAGSTKVMVKEFFGASIPSGTVFKGALGLDTQSSVDIGDFRILVSFPLPLSTPITSDDDIIVADNIEMQNGCSGGNCISAADLSLSSLCTGTATAPTAPAGKVCVYPLNTGSNTLAGSVEAFRMNDHEERFGFFVTFNSVAAGDLYFNGTWAYTAP